MMDNNTHVNRSIENRYKCVVCGRQKKDYKKLCCYNCFTKTKKNKNIFQKICDEWKLEAKQEGGEYFYFVDETNEILRGKKNLIIGRKGEGKTALAQYILEQNGSDIFTSKLSFKNFPFNTLYELENCQYTKPNQYISIWKYIIYATICKQMIRNSNIDSAIVEELKKIFPDADDEKKLSKMIRKYTVSEFGAQILGSGFSVGRKMGERNLSWIDCIDILENVILKNIDDKKYFIIFDELDEDYKCFNKDEEQERYFDLVTGLCKAVQDIKATFSDCNKHIFPLVFLRSDIFRLISYSDKNKWSDSILRIEWTTEKIKSLLTHRLNIVMDTEDLTFDECWTRLFGMYKIRTGTSKGKKMGSFEYMLRSTQNRPRDFIRYFQICSKLALHYGSYLVKPYIIKEADSEFSDYMKDEIIDEIYSVLPEYEEIFAILSQIRKQTFPPREFVLKYEKAVEDNEIANKGAEKILKVLFDFSVIGNVPSIKNQAIFKYEKDVARFNFKENIIVHRGLYKTLQIF